MEQIKRQLQIVFIFFLVLFAFRFFDARFIPEKLVHHVVFFYLLIAIVFSIPYVLIKQTGFVLPVQMIVLSVMLSIPMAYLAWGQNLRDTILETTPYLVLIVFFYLLQLQIRIKTIENIILIYGGLYILLYFYQLANADTVIFGKSLWGDTFTIDRNMVRIIFPGAGIFVLSIFMAVNKLTTQRKGRWLWLAFTVLGIIIPVLQVTRTFILGVLLLYLYHFIKDQSALKKILFTSLSVAAVFIYITTTENEIIKGLMEVWQRDFKLGADYIRVLSGTYFLTDFSPNILNRVLGNGVPAWGTSNYGLFIEKLAERREFFLEDVGIIGMYAMFGFFAVASWIIIWVKSFTIPLPKEYYYLKYYLWYLLFTSLTSWNIYIYHFLIATTFVLYLYQFIIQRTRTVQLDDGSICKCYFAY